MNAIPGASHRSFADTCVARILKLGIRIVLHALWLARTGVGRLFRGSRSGICVILDYNSVPSHYRTYAAPLNNLLGALQEWR